METSARFYLCARCRAQVLICRRCDRGHIYCSPSCSGTARQTSIRAAGQRYQTSRAGRFNHAERTRRYRERHKNVTHQGSMPPAQDDLLMVNSVVVREPDVATRSKPTHGVRHCHFCGCRCPEFVRYGFLHSRRVLTHVQSDRRGTHHHGHFT
jgi:hypothetical protein